MRRTALGSLCAIAAACSLSSRAAAQPTPLPWPMFRHDAMHTGKTAVRSLSIPSLAWSFHAAAAVDSSPAVGTGGRVHAGSDGGRYFCVSSDGHLAWSYLTGGVVLTSPALGAAGNAYVGADDHNLYAFTRNGALSWSYRTGFIVESAPVLGVGERVYAGSDDSRLYAIGSGGSLAWSYLTGGYVMVSPALAADVRIYAGSLDNNMYALTSAGAFVWSYVTGDDILSSPAVGPEGEVYAGSLDNRMYSLSSSGALAWTFATGGDIHSSPALGANGGICVGSLDNNIYSLTSAGLLAWSFVTGDWVLSSPAVDGGGRTLVGSGDGTLYALDSAGSLDWSYAAGGAVDSSPAVGADGRLFVGSRDGMIYALSDPSATPTVTATPTATPTPIRNLALMKREGGDVNLYCYSSLRERDWTYWDALSRNPSPLARDLWVVPSGNDAAAMAGKEGDGGGELLVLARDEGGDSNLYLYRSPAGGDWTYWDALSRNPSPLARDFWVIPSGNSAAAVAAVDITGDAAEDLAVLGRDGQDDMNIYYYRAPETGDWTYWDAAARNPSPLARDLWILPAGNNLVGMIAADCGGGMKKLALIRREGEGDLNLYVFNNLLPGDWTYWDALSRNPSPLARDLWIIPSGNDAVGIAAVNMDGDGPEELAVLKGNGDDTNLYCFRSPAPGDWTYWDALYRNPVALARDFWIIPSGNDAAAMAAVRLR